MDDLISRQAAIDIVSRSICPTGDATYDNARESERESIREELEQLPSADRKGHWEMKTDPYGFFEEIPVCSECGHTTEMRKTYNFCPECGADMRERSKKEDR